MTAKTIRIDDDVYDALRQRAHAFESPNAVLRRVLNVPDNATHAAAKPQRNGKAKQHANAAGAK